MKHNREDYNRIQDPEGLIASDEPVFLVRSKDKLCPTTTRVWALLYAMIHDESTENIDDNLNQLVENLQDYVDQSCTMSDDTKALVESVMRFADEMEAWQKENGSKKPDAPIDLLQA